MKIIEIKKQLQEVVNTLPKDKLEEILDFATLLMHKSTNKDDYFRLQMTSNAYIDWVGKDNDIYDRFFKYAYLSFFKQTTF